jgi:hypothetical protein
MSGGNLIPDITAIYSVTIVTEYVALSGACKGTLRPESTGRIR